jgi:hypothetical protein
MQELEAGTSAIPANKGRIVVYRTGIMGTAIQPTVLIDGVERGKCQPNGAFTVDVAQGQRTVSTSTEVRRQTVVTVEQGQTSYVRCSIGFGVLVGQPRLEAVPEDVGIQESAPLALTGRF